jgi:heavy metal sensor kinase
LIAFVVFRLRDQEFRRIDTELEGAANSLVSVLRGVPPPELSRGVANSEADAGEEISQEPRGQATWERLGAWDDPPGTASSPPRGTRRWQRNLVLPPAFVYDNEDIPHYFIVWQTGTGVLARSQFAPAVSDIYVPRSLPPTAPYLYASREMRTIIQRGPQDTFVAVSRSINRELDRLNHWLAGLVLFSLALFAGATFGGGWLIQRALRPLEQMSTAAAAISADNLSQRIDVAEIDRELQQLADTLNATFARLEDSFQRQAAFTADASHELRTPLTILLGRLELLLMQMKSAGDQPAANMKEEVQVCFRAAQRMRGLVEQLLLLAKADAGKLPFEPQSFDLSPIVEECLELLTPLAEAKNVTIQTTLKPAEVLGDPQLLSQVVINLVTNAIQYNRPAGLVRVEVHTEPAGVLLEIADNGPGIPSADQGRVFERFFRVDASRSREGGGNGLGLAITRSIVQLHRGEIGLESSAEKGTTVRVRLAGGRK